MKSKGMMDLKSKTIRFRLIEESDAGFVLSLRVDGKYNAYLSKVTPNLDAQRKWISEYKNDESKGVQYYFIIELNDGTPCGTVRLYDFKGDSFCWGSWILNEKKTKYAALESAFLVYQFGFEQLNFKKSHFDVMKGNEQVISFHKKLGAIEISKDDDNYYFEIGKEKIESKKKYFAKFL